MICSWNYSERLLDATIIRDIFPLRINAVYLHVNLRDGIACVLIYKKNNCQPWRHIVNPYSWCTKLIHPIAIMVVKEDIILPYRWDIVLADENHRLPHPSTTYEDYHPCRTVYLCRRIHEWSRVRSRRLFRRNSNFVGRIYGRKGAAICLLETLKNRVNMQAVEETSCFSWCKGCKKQASVFTLETRNCTDLFDFCYGCNKRSRVPEQYSTGSCSQYCPAGPVRLWPSVAE